MPPATPQCVIHLSQVKQNGAAARVNDSAGLSAASLDGRTPLGGSKTSVVVPQLYLRTRALAVYPASMPTTKVRRLPSEMTPADSVCHNGN
jgi:hypothetical protein